VLSHSKDADTHIGLCGGRDGPGFLFKFFPVPDIHGTVFCLYHRQVGLSLTLRAASLLMFQLQGCEFFAAVSQFDDQDK
jgi:hypothetical protein